MRPSRTVTAVTAILTWAMILAMLVSLSLFVNLDPERAVLIGLAAVSVGYGYVLALKPGQTLLVTLGAVLAAAVWALVYAPARAFVIALLGALYLFWNESMSGTLVAVDPLVARFFIASLALGMGILCLWQFLRRRDTFWPLLAGVILFGFEWLYYFDTAYLYFLIFLGLNLVLRSLLSAAKLRSAWSRDNFSIRGFSLFRSGLGWGVAVSLVLVAALQVLPSSFEPWSLDDWADRLERIIPAIKNWRGGSEGESRAFRFTLASTGFTRRNTELGGPVKLDPTTVMKVGVRGRANELPWTLYLRGVAEDIYTGRGWRSGVGRPAPRSPGEPLGPGYPADVSVMDVELTIAPLRLRTSTLFSALEPVRAEVGDRTIFADSSGNLTVRSPFGSRDSKSDGMSYKIFFVVPKPVLNQVKSLSPDRAEPGSPYLQLPPTLPKRVRDLAREVAGDGHPYEQALAIEDYLRATYPYILDTPPTPRGGDFVDYFLFDLKQGYCTYYSSAMVVMLRSLSIPARWVQGFVISPITGSGAYEVSNDDAHAWVEAYFPGYGWLTFDPTPRFTPPERRVGTPVQVEDPGSDQTQSNSQPAVTSGSQPKGGRQPWDEEIISSSQSGQKRIPLLWTLLPLSVALYLAGYGIWLKRTEVLPGRDSSAAVHRAFSNVSRLLSRFGIRRDPGHTVSEFSSDLVKRWPSMEAPLKYLTEAFQVARYGPADALSPNVATPRKTRVAWNEIKKTLRLSYGTLRYWAARLAWWRGLEVGRRRKSR